MKNLSFIIIVLTCNQFHDYSIVIDENEHDYSNTDTGMGDILKKYMLREEKLPELFSKSDHESSIDYTTFREMIDQEKPGNSVYSLLKMFYISNFKSDLFIDLIL